MRRFNTLRLKDAGRRALPMLAEKNFEQRETVYEPKPIAVAVSAIYSNRVPRPLLLVAVVGQKRVMARRYAVL
jgi:hypothetical protein